MTIHPSSGHITHVWIPAFAGMALCLFMLFAALTVHAQDFKSTAPIGENQQSVQGELGTLNVIKADLTKPAAGIPAIVGRVLQWVLFVVGAVALVVFVYAGVVWMIALGQGKGESARSAMRIIAWASFGLAVIFMSYFIINYVIKALQKAAGAA